jgi:hypothetical protein
MTPDNFQPGKKLENFETTKTNLYVMGALSRFKGFGGIIASYFDKDKLKGEDQLKMIRLLDEWDKQVVEKNNDKISSGFIEQKDGKIFFGENSPRYTQFPQQNRFYRQTVYSWVENFNSDYINAGKIFSAMKPFKQYEEQSSGQEPLEISYKKEGLQTPEKLMNILNQILEPENLGKKLFIKAYPENEETLLAEKALEYEPVKIVMNAFDELSPEKRKNFSLFFGDPDAWGISGNQKVTILLTEIRKSLEDYYLSKGNIFVEWKDIIS